VAEWRRIEAMIDELEDIRALDAALARPDRRMIPFEVTSAILDGASPIRAWREHRGMGLGALAKAAGIEPARLMKLEAGTRKAAPNELRRLAGSGRRSERSAFTLTSAQTTMGARFTHAPGPWSRGRRGGRGARRRGS
jgi:hypothetical protein